MNEMTNKTPAAGSDLALANAWAAVGDWLEEVRHNGGDHSQETANTYSFHVAKLRWYCEQFDKPLTQWTKADANSFVAFLRDLPIDCLCKMIDTGRSRPGLDGRQEPIMRFARIDEPGYTPFRTVPSSGSRADILRCVRALFAQLHEEGIIRRNPMAKVKARKSRQIKTERSLDLDLYAYVLAYLDSLPVVNEIEARLRARDRFAFVALRELGLRASELVGTRMRDVYALTDSKNGVTYWILKVGEEVAKGGVERDVPLTRIAFEELMAYRTAFGLSPVPESTEEYGLLLSTKTRPMAIGNQPLTEAKSRRYFHSWASISSRKTLYAIITGRLEEAAQSLKLNGRPDEANKLLEVSPHWLRHTFAKALIVRGRDIRVVAESLGHASVTTTMAYTKQSALDQAREYGKDGDLATQGPAHVG